MIKKIFKLVKNHKAPQNKGLFELPAAEQKKILKKAVSEANREQRDLVERYDRKFGEFQKGSCEV